MLSRRAFLASGSAATLLGPSWAARGQGAVGTRRSIRDMGGNDPDLAAYRRAVAAMKALPPSDPRNWNRFADIHRNFCPHGNWYFLPWHRAYLVALERICRDLSGKADFALPYWNWTVERELPAAFTGDNNPLSHRRPGFGRGASLSDDMVGQAVMSRIMNSPDFEAFGSTRPRGQSDASAQWQRRTGAKTEFEFNPHDGVHQTLGGDMATVANSSRDPIFYLHHANVDRLWSAWNARGNDNSPEAIWRNFTFSRNFINPNGSPWSVSVEELQSPPALGYRYDNDREPLAADVDVDMVVAQNARTRALANPLLAYRRIDQEQLMRWPGELRRISLSGGGQFYVATAGNDRVAAVGRPLDIPVPFGRPIGDVIRPGALSASRLYAEGNNERQCVWAMLHDIDQPIDPKTRVHVFINRDGLSPNTTTSDPHYVTSFSFFGGEHAAHGQHNHAGHSHSSVSMVRGGTVCLDLSQALSRLGGSRHYRSDRLVVQLLPTCQNGDERGSSLRARRVQIAII